MDAFMRVPSWNDIKSKFSRIWTTDYKFKHAKNNNERLDEQIRNIVSVELPESYTNFKTREITISSAFLEEQRKRRNQSIAQRLARNEGFRNEISENQRQIRSYIDKLRHPTRLPYQTSNEAYYDATKLYQDRDSIDQEIFYIKPSLPKLTDKHLELLKAAQEPYPRDQILVDSQGVTIARKDIQTLLSLNWLNDEVINFYMNLLVERGRNSRYPNVYSFNTFFYSKLRSSGHSSLKRWTRKVDIFSYELLLVPVHVGQNHWCLAMIDLKNKQIAYYDSLGGSPQGCHDILADYLRDEHMDKKKQEFCLDGWNFDTSYEQIPQQQNGSDCGVFTCTYAEFLTRRAKLDFEQRDMPYFRKKMIVEILTKTLLIM